MIISQVDLSTPLETPLNTPDISKWIFLYTKQKKEKLISYIDEFYFYTESCVDLNVYFTPKQKKTKQKTYDKIIFVKKNALFLQKYQGKAE